MVALSCSSPILNLTWPCSLHFTVSNPHLLVIGSHAAVEQVDTVVSLGAAHLRQAHFPWGDLPTASRRGAEVAADRDCSNSSLDSSKLGTAECAEVEPAPTRQRSETKPSPGCSCCASFVQSWTGIPIEGSPSLKMPPLGAEQCDQLAIRGKADLLSASRTSHLDPVWRSDRFSGKCWCHGADSRKISPHLTLRQLRTGFQISREIL